MSGTAPHPLRIVGYVFSRRHYALAGKSGAFGRPWVVGHVDVAFGVEGGIVGVVVVGMDFCWSGREDRDSHYHFYL